jgi:hypothetical protein
VNEWYNNTLRSRLDDKLRGAIIIVMQRLHIHDLTGSLLQGSEDWVVLTSPTIAEVEERIQIGEDQSYGQKIETVEKTVSCPFPA